MSTLIVEIIQIKEILKHPNADRLEIARIRGWEVIVQLGTYITGDYVVYVPIDAVLPIELSDKLGVTNYLSKGRVKTVKLRGVYSQGLIINMKHLPDGCKTQNIGENLKDVFGITKYIPPPPPVQMSGKHRKQHPDFHKYTNIENIKNYPDILQEGELVSISEKLHGTSYRVANIDGEIHVGSHNIDLEENYDNLYWQAYKLYNLGDILEPDMILYGEVYGYGVQKLTYNLKTIDLVFFDLSIKGKYIDSDDFKEFCKKHNLPQVPILYEGPWDKSLMDLANGQSTIASHIREGIVIKPVKERYDRTVDRVVLKHISEKYLLKDYGDLQ